VTTRTSYSTQYDPPWQHEALNDGREGGAEPITIVNLFISNVHYDITIFLYSARVVTFTGAGR
jgi:hypothetical protein